MRRNQNITDERIQKYIQDHKWVRPDYYAGPDHTDSVAVLGQSRDSDLVEESNFQVALDLLGGESETVEVIRDGHWACGWVETIRVSIRDLEKIKIACEIEDSLENYGVLDDDHHSQMEWDYYHEYAKDNASSVVSVLVQLFGLPEELESDKEMIDLAIQLNMEHQLQNGPDSSLFSNQYHVGNMDAYDIASYERALTNLDSYYHDSEAYKLVAACFGLLTEEGA